MKILIPDYDGTLLIDYDGTLLIDDNVTQQDIKKINEFRKRGNMFIIIHTGTKEEIIQIFINQNNICKSIITTVEDELDDFNMLKLYNGYRMEKCNDVLRQNIKQSVKSVSELIDLIM